MKTKFTIVFLFLALQINNLQAQWTVETVPDPKTSGLGFTSNPDGILTAEEISLIDSAVKVLEDSSKAQIAIIMLQSIGSETPKTFATELFNKWGIGSSGNDNGLLILFVMDQRRIEFETGYGIENILTDAKCYQIQQDYMVPKFKEGNYGQGMVAGVKAVVNVFMKNLEEITPTGDDLDVSDSYASQDSELPYRYYKKRSGLDKYGEFAGFYFRAVIFFTGLFLLFLVISLLLKNHFSRYQLMRIFTLYIWFLLFPIPFVILHFITRSLLEKWRNTPRISAKTGKLMHKLNEKEDNKFLEKGQVAEETAKSVDYDVWVTDEPEDVLIIAYKRWFSKYNSCPKCRYKTYYKVYDRVISSPTYTSSGSGEKKFSCTNCKHIKIKRYTIPKKTKSSSSSSSSRSSWGGGSSWGGSSSSSWGGGSSGGGGAGSSW